MLNETQKRKPTFDESASAPVTFPGGDTLFVPKPLIRLRPTFRAGKRVDEARLVSGDAEFDRLKSEVEAAIHDDTRDFGGAVTDVAVYMLSKNYDLTDDELADLFAIAMDGAAPDVQWMTRVMAIAHGQNAPKVGSGGES